MAITRSRPSRCVIIVGLLTCLVCAGCGRPAQIGNDDHAWATADALWTAVGAKRADLVAKASTDLERLHSKGDLSDAAHRALLQVVETAKAGDWSTARADLRDFIEGQRRPR